MAKGKTEVLVVERRKCDVCAHERGIDKEAAYDGKTVDGPWANMCQEDFTHRGLGLGTGLGQRLVLMVCKTCDKPVADHRKQEADEPTGIDGVCDKTQMEAMSK